MCPKAQARDHIFRAWHLTAVPAVWWANGTWRFAASYALFARPERQARPRVRADEPVWNFRLRCLVEKLAAAMQRNDVLDVHALERGDRAVNVVVRRRRQMKSADHGVHLVDSRDRLCLLERVENASMAARCEHDQSSVLHIEAGRDLMPELVGNRNLRSLLFRQPIGKTSQSVINADSHGSRRAQLFETAKRDPSGAEALVGDQSRARGISYPEAGLPQRNAIKDSEVLHGTTNPLARAKAVFASDIEWEAR